VTVCRACGLDAVDLAQHLSRHGLSEQPKPDPDSESQRVLAGPQREVATESGLIVIRDVPTNEGGYL
jgi:hypothetical protein